ncbi:outer membrane beta-barrel protein [Helicobacter hepaticus]|jgi:hypothetical protein|uniref:Outer membrane protein beta-barrel domain-containing protein n=1 Tax=Helicobacter hepaticus (strain ATCC 51449 / 3B1) TaxID=235279 RepID=Q7VGK9_HELHP|nr:outer membrane beta-barrel protein [Helicobacter hepaticus]AAP77909.1 hypothetical protein HH_1312 [Helicobacter hepaticus ATCC 51449]
MKKFLAFISLTFAFCAFGADEQKYRFIAGGSIGSQTTWFKNADTNVKWSNMGETLYNEKGGLSGRGAVGLQINTSQKLFTRILAEITHSNLLKSDSKPTYRSYGITWEEGYRFTPRFYTFGGPGVHYAQLKLNDESTKGFGVNVNLGLGFVLSDFVSLEVMGRGSFPLSDKFKEIGANNNESLPMRIDYLANIMIAF